VSQNSTFSLSVVQREKYDLGMLAATPPIKKNSPSVKVTYFNRIGHAKSRAFKIQYPTAKVQAVMILIDGISQGRKAPPEKSERNKA